MSLDACDLLCLDLDTAERIRSAAPSAEELGWLSEVARSLGDPTRLRVLLALDQADELCVCDLGWIVGASQSLSSHHLRKLRAAGLVTARREGKIVFYSIASRGAALVRSLFDEDAVTR